MGKRLFVSVDLDGLAEGIAQAQSPLTGTDGLRLTDPEQAHVTLKFLGETDPDRVEEVVAELERAVADAGVDPFQARFGGLGVFPSMEYITVVWVGVEAGGEDLRALHREIERRTTDLGFDPTDHDFTPHVTVARMDHAGEKAYVQRVVREHDPLVGTLDVTEVRLTESVLTDEGPTYETVAAVEL